jgi:anti-sigma B factor antagonist
MMVAVGRFSNDLLGVLPDPGESRMVCSSEGEMEFKVERIGDVTVIQICTESLRADNVQDFKSKISDLVKPDAKIVLDLITLKFVDSSGIGALLSCFKDLNSSNGSLSLCNVTEPVRNLFELVRVHRFLRVFDSCNEAVRAFSS